SLLALLKNKHVLSISFILYCSSAGMVYGDSVTPDKEEYTPTERSSVSLRCTYETSSNYVYLYWYRHYCNQAPQFLLYKGDRFDAHLNVSGKSVPLTIQRVQLSDSAVYYCALRPTVAGNLRNTKQKLILAIETQRT
uniref:T-cell receptor alpha/delta variable 22.0 n=1 Tax=Oncorhynchus kisutch TaxID=8019 RepID=A0A8C7HM97_ONCKI